MPVEISNKKALGVGPRASNWVQGLDLNQRPSGYMSLIPTNQQATGISEELICGQAQSELALALSAWLHDTQL
jgi:hypothetical protein